MGKAASSIDLLAVGNLLGIIAAAAAAVAAAAATAVAAAAAVAVRVISIWIILAENSCSSISTYILDIRPGHHTQQQIIMQKPTADTSRY
jgi:hypothetical protein